MFTMVVVKEKIKSKSPVAWPEMDPGIWRRLPEELRDYILCLLPLKTFLGLRSTCKHFNSLVFSPNFISKHSPSSSSASSPSPFPSFLLLSHPQFHPKYPLYDTVLNNAWCNPSLSLFPKSNTTPSLLSTSNGLLCFSVPNSSSFIICNLWARSSRVVMAPTRPFDFELPTLISTPKGYKLFLLSTSFGSSNNAFVYDSATHNWHQFEGFNPIVNDNYNKGGVFFNGLLCFTIPEPFAIVGFDLDSGKWERRNLELPDQTEVTFVRLVASGDGRLFLFSGVGRNGISRSMKLWELINGQNWGEAETVPEMVCKKFLSVCYHNYEHVYCFWHQGMICVCCNTWPEVLYYKVLRKTWHWIPKCPSLPDKWSCGFRWFSFVPDLYAWV